MSHWPRIYDPVPCGCHGYCGDVPEDLDDPDAVCKGLASKWDPLVKVVVVPRLASMDPAGEDRGHGT